MIRLSGADWVLSGLEWLGMLAQHQSTFHQRCFHKIGTFYAGSACECAMHQGVHVGPSCAADEVPSFLREVE